MNPTSSNSTEKASSLWFLAGFLATLLAGIAKVVIADHFSPDSAGDSG